MDTAHVGLLAFGVKIHALQKHRKRIQMLRWRRRDDVRPCSAPQSHTTAAEQRQGTVSGPFTWLSSRSGLSIRAIHVIPPPITFTPPVNRARCGSVREPGSASVNELAAKRVKQRWSRPRRYHFLPRSTMVLHLRVLTRGRRCLRQRCKRFWWSRKDRPNAARAAELTGRNLVERFGRDGGLGHDLTPVSFPSIIETLKAIEITIVKSCRYLGIKIAYNSVQSISFLRSSVPIVCLRRPCAYDCYAATNSYPLTDLACARSRLADAWTCATAAPN